MDTSTRLRTLSLRSARLSICLWLLRRRLRWLPRATVASAATVVNGYRGGYLWGRARRIWCRTWRRSPGWRRSQRPQVIDRRYMRVSRIFPGPAVTWLNGWLAPRPRVPSDYIAPSEGCSRSGGKGDSICPPCLCAGGHDRRLPPASLEQFDHFETPVGVCSYGNAAQAACTI